MSITSPWGVLLQVNNIKSLSDIATEFSQLIIFMQIKKKLFFNFCECRMYIFCSVMAQQQQAGAKGWNNPNNIVKCGNNLDRCHHL